MFLQSKLFKFLLSCFSYLVFAIVWVNNYLIVLYANQPEETRDFVGPSKINFYLMFAYLFIVSLIIFLALGLIYLLKTEVPRFINYLIIGNLFFSTYYVWLYSTKFIDMRTNRIFLFLDLILIGFSIFNFSKITKSTKNSGIN